MSWDAETARRWYRRGREIADRAPYVVDDIRTGRESTRFNPRDNIRPADVDWEGYEHTVTTLRARLWQVTGIGRTLVDAADERRTLPRRPTSCRATPTRSAALARGGLAVRPARRGRDDGLRPAASAQALDVLTSCARRCA